MGDGNGTKSSAQLDREVNDILRARQKREARERTAASRSVGIPSQAEYEQRELREANQRLSEVERAPLADRKEAAAEFFEAMRDDPELVAERVGWLLGGNYDYGQMMMAKRVLGAPRMNRVAALTQMVAAFEWSSPGAMTRAAWKKLTKGQQAALERAVQGEIADAEREE
jgi:3-oxoacyl-[acyl-carrier-protein] synthase III